MMQQSQSHIGFWNALLQFVLNILLGIYHLKGRIGCVGIINVKGTKHMNEWCNDFTVGLKKNFLKTQCSCVSFQLLPFLFLFKSAGSIMVSAQVRIFLRCIEVTPLVGLVSWWLVFSNQLTRDHTQKMKFYNVYSINDCETWVILKSICHQQQLASYTDSLFFTLVILFTAIWRWQIFAPFAVSDCCKPVSYDSIFSTMSNTNQQVC